MKPFTQDELNDLGLLAGWAEDNGFTRAAIIKAASVGFIDELSDDYIDNPQSSRFRMQTDEEAMSAIAIFRRRFEKNPASVFSAIGGWNALTEDEQAEVISETHKLAALVPHLV